MSDDFSDMRIRSRLLAREDRNRMTNLISLRRGVSATQSDVAQLLGVPTEWVREIESYDSDPRLSELRRYENAVCHLAYSTGITVYADGQDFLERALRDE